MVNCCLVHLALEGHSHYEHFAEQEVLALDLLHGVLSAQQSRVARLSLQHANDLLDRTVLLAQRNQSLGEVLLDYVLYCHLQGEYLEEDLSAYNDSRILPHENVVNVTQT